MASFAEEELRRDAALSIAKAFAWAGMTKGLIPGKAMPAGQPVPPEALLPRTAEVVVAFDWLVEHRTWGNRSYSCCVDCAGGFMSLLGCRYEGIVNRDDDDHDGVKDTKQEPAEGRGVRDWRSGLNVVLFNDGAKKAGCWVDASKLSKSENWGDGCLFKRADFFLIGEGQAEHVGMVLTEPEIVEWAQDKTAEVYSFLSIEGGQVDTDGTQCIKVYETFLFIQDGKRPYLTRDKNKAGRPLIGWIDTSRLPLTEPALVPPDFEGGVPVQS